LAASGGAAGIFAASRLASPLSFLDDFLAQFPFGRKRAPVDYAKRFFLLVIGQGNFLSDLSRFAVYHGLPARVAAARSLNLRGCEACQSHRGTVKWEP